MRGTDNVLLWAHEHDIEPGALDQIRNVSKLPPVEAVRIMPDVHHGYGATIGTVIGMRGAVAPMAVGVDIGCGVNAQQTNLKVGDLKEGSLARIRASVERLIPVGFNLHSRPVDVPRFGSPGTTTSYHALWAASKDLNAEFKDKYQLERAAVQLGSLGGGNHFIEVCSSVDGYLWLTLHSGSRNIGKEIAEYHTGVAKTLPWNRGLGDLAYLIEGRPEYHDYLQDLYWAQEYAWLNRQTMMFLFHEAVRSEFEDVVFAKPISCHHNYVSEEAGLVVTRKGAISAHTGDWGVIPGSMAVGSYIVLGLGNPDSLYSAAHGAGRKLSRGAAKRAFTVEDLIEQTKGIESRKDAGILDEIPGAYKDFGAVMAAQSNLVRQVTHLQTIMCVKG
jgi:tRNA-splicing ligase RtcB